MARRSFSLMLAWRYLNPRRAMLSSVTIISVLGVLLGVWILVVVMSVYNGMEGQVKERLLGYAPHIKLELVDHGTRIPLQDWREVTEKLAHFPGVESASPYIQDFVIMDSEGRHRPGVFRAVDTQNAAQMEGIQKMLDTKSYPDSSADMGLDKRVIISSTVAEQLGLGVGDKIKLYSARNFEQVQRPYELTNQPLVRERFHELLTGAEEALAHASTFKKEDDLVLIPEANYRKLVAFSNAVYPEMSSFRDEEAGTVNDFLLLLETDDKTPEGRRVPADAPAQAAAKLKQLEENDRDQMDLKTLKSIREVILPQEADIIGISRSSQMAVTPDVFLPMAFAQQLSGMTDAAQAISIRLYDHYKAEPISQELLKELPPGWQATTWVAEFGSFSDLINQQRVMMYIVLSMIMVISAFSMMAVMFTVTIQKRREIGVMKALGAAPGQIVRVFLNQGIILGAVGSIAGVGFALLTLRLRGQLQAFLRTAFNFDPFPERFNGFDILPAHLVPAEVTIIAISAFVLCALAAMVPAFVASRSDAAKSLRNL